MQVGQLVVPEDGAAMSIGTVFDFTREPLDWQPLLGGLTACQRLQTLELDDKHVGATALQVTALTRLTKVTVAGADEATQVHLSTSLGAHCQLLFPPVSPNMVNPR